MKKIIILFMTFFLICSQLFSKDIRILSLAPSITETLFAVGLTEKEIVGVTDYCNYPKEANNILRVGSLTTINIEKIVSLRPDYIFSIGTEFSPLNMRLKKAGLKVVVSNPQTIEETISNILMLGKIVHREKGAEAVIEQMKRRLDKIERKVKRLQNKKKVYVEIWDDPLTSCGKGSLVDEIVTRAGGINITGSINIPYPTISQEFVLKEDPDIMVLGYMARDQKDIIKTFLNRFGWQDVTAIKTKNVICDIDPDIFLRPTPRIVDGIEQIHNRIYGNR